MKIKRALKWFAETATTLIMLLLFLASTAQEFEPQKEYHKSQASEIIPGSNYIKESKSSTIPSRVNFSDEGELSQENFFSWFSTTFKLNSDITFQELSNSTDDLGNTHIRYSVLYKDILIENNWLIVHSNGGTVYSYNGDISIITKTKVISSYNESEALEMALNTINAKAYLWESPEEEQLLKNRQKNQSATYYPKGVLVLLESNKTENIQFVLAWRFEIRTNDIELDQKIYIDAITGEKLKSLALVHQCNVGTVSTTWYGSQNINTDKNGDDDFILLDDCGGAEIHTTTTTGGDFTNSDNSWNSAGETGPATTHFHGKVTMSYFSSIHSRDSYNNAGGDLELRHINDANAYWLGGGLIRIGSDATDANFYNTLDVVAHEFTHGVIDSEANLTYQGESGALNESFCDILGETCEIWYEGIASSSWDWLHREDYFDGNNRSFINPKDKSDPDTYNGTFWKSTAVGDPDAGGVHTNSGVQNHWFYLLVVGASGTNDNLDDYVVNGIGLVKARNISYDNLTNQLGASSDYSDARTGSIAATIARYGDCSNELKQVINAWYAVGVGDPYVDVELTSFEDVSCAGATDGSITISAIGNGTLTYSWDDGPNTQNRSNLSGGTYTVTVTDETGCTASISKTIFEPAAIAVLAVATSDFHGFNISCNGLSDGVAEAVGAGGTMPYSYLWDANAGSQNTAIASGLSAGTYWVTISDANGCSAMTSVTLIEPPLLTAAISDKSDYNGFNISCNGGSDGWATVTAGGGVDPYSYDWGNGQTSATATGLMAGLYSVTITDLNGCQESTSITLTEPTPLTIEAGDNQTVYFGYPPAECATITWSTAGGGVAPYTITWDNGGAQSHEVCPGEFTTDYTVTIIDANGCIEMDVVSICVIDVRCGKKLDKVELCHVPEFDPGNEHTICVSVNAVATHLAHGDMLAACGTDHSCPPTKIGIVAENGFVIENEIIVYPNPFNQSTKITFISSAEGIATLKLYDVSGRLIQELHHSMMYSGQEYKVEVDGSILSSGINYCIIQFPDGTIETKKLIFTK